MKKYFLIALCLVFIVLPSSVQADNLSPYIEPYLPKAELVGQGKLNLMFWDIYNVKLFSPKGAYSPGQPAALVFTYLRDVKGKDIADSSVKEIQRFGMGDQQKLSSWHEQLISIIPNVHEGVTLSAVYLPAGDTVFLEEGKVIGTINDKDFGQYFFKIWLDPRTREPALRRTLLGQMAP